jgi:uncharacterized membrane protein
MAWLTSILTLIVESFTGALDSGLKIAKKTMLFAGLDPNKVGYTLGPYFTALGGYLGKVERILPIVEMLTLLAAGFVVVCAIRTVRWVLAFIPTLNAG